MSLPAIVQTIRNNPVEDMHAMDSVAMTRLIDPAISRSSGDAFIV